MSDDTGEFFPFRDEGQEDAEVPPKGGTRKGDADDAGTQIFQPDEAEATTVYQPIRESDATTVYQPVRDSDATAVYRPASGADPWAEDADEIWAGRAGVGASGPRDPGPGTGWAADPGTEEPGGRWWTPILVGVVAFVLLGLLGWGIYLIVQNSGDDPEAPGPVTTTPMSVPSTTTRLATTEPTTEPTTPPTSPTPAGTTPSTPADLTIPALRGLSLDEARAALNRTGLSYRLRYVYTTEAPAGTVLDSDPAEGQQVPADTIVNLIIASEPTTAPTTPAVPTDTGSAPSPQSEQD